MADMLEDCLTDLGQRRPPSAWVSTCYKLVDRQQVKQQRRQELETGAGADVQKGSGSDSKSSSSKHALGTDTHYGLRRRDEHALLPPSQRSSRAAKQESIARQLHMKKEPIDQSLTWLPPEDEEGHIEYKYKLSHPPPHPIRLQQLITQMKFRLSEGGGQCFYYLGVEDDGYPKGLGPAELDASMATLHKMAQTLNVQATLVRIFPGAHGRRCGLLRVQRGMLQEVGYLDLRIAVAGCVDAGKSTLVAVLTHGTNGTATLDTGRGSARVVVLRHKHEIESGRTSSLSHQFLGYDSEGRVLNYMGSSSAPTLTEVCSSANKLLTFIDMGGHERCLKTALYGMTALLPDYALLCCCAVGGLGQMSREHLAVAVALHIPVAVCITKADLVDEAGLAAVIEDIHSLIALAWPALSGQSNSGTLAPALTLSPAPTNGPHVIGLPQPADLQAPQAAAASSPAVATQVAPIIQDEAAAEAAAHALGQLHIQNEDDPGMTNAATSPPFMVPIFPISSVTGQGLDVLHAFLRSLQPGQQLRKSCVPPVTAMASAPDLTALGNTENQDVAHLSLPVDTSTAATSGIEGLQSDDVLQEQHPAASRGAKLAGQTLRAAGSGSAEDSGVHFQVDQTFDVPSVGSVVSGMVLSGLIRLGQVLLLGPTVTGSFVEVTITGIQRAHIPVQLVRAGQAATLALRPVATAHSAHVTNHPAALQGHTRSMHSHKDEQNTTARHSPAASQAPASRSGMTEAEVGQGTACMDANRSSTPACAAQPQQQTTGAMEVSPDLLELFDMDNEDEAGSTAQDGDMSGLLGEDESSTPPRSRTPAPPAPCQNTRNSRTSRAADTFHMNLGNSRQAVPGSSFPPDTRPRLQHEALLRGDGHGNLASSPSLPSFLLSSSPSSASHRGAVLLGTALAPRTTWQFDAVLILLGGHWPPRGLVSGCWPPLEEPTTDMVPAVCGAEQQGNGSRALEPAGDSEVHESSVRSGGYGVDSTAESRRQGTAMGTSSATDRSTSCSDVDVSLVQAALGSRQLAQCDSTERSLSCSAPAFFGFKRAMNGCNVHNTGEVHVLSHVAQASPHCTTTLSIERDTSQDTTVKHKCCVGGDGLENSSDVHAAGGLDSPVRTVTGMGVQEEEGMQHHKPRRAGKRRARASQFTCVIHCANVRQLARLVSMQEFNDPNSPQPRLNSGQLLSSTMEHGQEALQAHVHVTPRMQAAAALLHAPWQPGQHHRSGTVPAEPLDVNVSQNDADTAMGVLGSFNGYSSDLGCIVKATFRFEHRPEWLCCGARLVVRDRSTGHVSGAGYVQAVHT